MLDFKIQVFLQDQEDVEKIPINTNKLLQENKAIPGKVQGEVHRAKRATRDYSATGMANYRLSKSICIH